MNYVLIDTDWITAPTVKLADPTKVQVTVNVITGIVGQPYAGFQNTDTIVMEFPISMTGSDMQADTQVQAAAYVATKYPNT